MSIINIVTEPNEILRRKSKEVLEITPKINTLIQNMIDTLRSKPGVGIAAPQIGKNTRLIVIESRGIERENGELADVIPLIVLINPAIKKFSKEKVVMEEGCFSVPNCFAPVERPKKIKVEATDIYGKKIVLNASGLLSRAIQHEVDHLDGILFTDYVKDKNLLKFYNPNNDGNNG